MYYMRWEVNDDDNDNDNTSVVHKCNAMIQMTMMKISKKVSLPEGALRAQWESQHPRKYKQMLIDQGSVVSFSMPASKPVHGREQFVRTAQSVELLPLPLQVCPA